MSANNKSEMLLGSDEALQLTINPHRSTLSLGRKKLGDGKIVGDPSCYPGYRKFVGARNSDFPRTDLDHALMIDRFDFAMEIDRRDGLLVLRAV